jgi:hypothetical protein
LAQRFGLGCGTTVGSWVYLKAGGKKIGVALSAGIDTKMIVLGATSISAFEEALFMFGVVPSGVVDGAITGAWMLDL